MTDQRATAIWEYRRKHPITYVCVMAIYYPVMLCLWLYYSLRLVRAKWKGVFLRRQIARLEASLAELREQV